MEFYDEREKMPELDESIFFPERAAMALGLTMEDLEAITKFVRWLHQQRELQDRKPRERLIQTLRARQKQLVDQKRLELLAELRGLEKLNSRF